ncbi:hypothetical protein [Streptomyces sp. AB3(2024)]|uniref:hypothetical protein n=1 Tax=Streptomyces sp. AB3(2024) TaxID=3317321 RepID=UPI0035A2F49B
MITARVAEQWNLERDDPFVNITDAGRHILGFQTEGQGSSPRVREAGPPAEGVAVGAGVIPAGAGSRPSELAFYSGLGLFLSSFTESGNPPMSYPKG